MRGAAGVGNGVVPRGDTAALPRSVAAFASRVLAAVAALVFAFAAAIAFATTARADLPAPRWLGYGPESAAFDEASAALRFNPATTGLRHPSEFGFVTWRPAGGREAYRGVFAGGGASLGLSGAENERLGWDATIAGGEDALRWGATLAWVPDGDRTAQDLRVGVLGRPRPWLSLGGVADHVGAPRVGGRRIDRAYTLGLAVRPFAWSRTAAHTWGPRLTLTADAEKDERQEWRDVRHRYGVEAEVLPGLALRGRYHVAGLERGVEFGVSVHGVHAAFHSLAGRTDDGDRVYDAHAISLHEGEERTLLAGRADRRVAVVTIDGVLGDESLGGVSLLGSGSNTEVAPIHDALERALDDPLTRGVLLDLRGAGNMAQLEELRPRIARLRDAGKPVVAYLEEGVHRGDLYLAAACDRVVTSPEGFSTGLGLRVERRSYRTLLENWGIKVDRASYGRYKSGMRNLSVDSTTAADRESIENQIDVAQELFVATVAEDRKIARDRLLAILDGRQWRPADFQAAGVVDSIGYREDALRLLGSLAGLGRKPHTVNLAERPEAARLWTTPGRIAVVYASGDLAGGASGNDLLFGATLGAATLVRQLERAFRNPAVEAIVLRVESPGGQSLASDLIHHATVRLKHETGKPFIVSMGSVAASGGYHIAAAADRIYADRFTRTGSIGVYYIKPSLEGWYAKHHVRQEEFERGPFMRGWSPNRDWDERLQAAADSTIYASYQGFVASVADGRHMTWDAVHEVAQGRVWMGEDARTRGLVDQIGGLEEALAEARVRAGIPAAEKIAVLEYRRARPGFLQRALGGWLAERWAETMRTPEPGVYWLDDEALP